MTNQTEHGLTPIAFDGVDQELSLVQKLAIPRVPVRIGFVPNPTVFSNRQDTDTTFVLNLRLDKLGMHTRLLDEPNQQQHDAALALGQLLQPFYPTLSLIAAHHAEHDPNILLKEWHLRIVRQRADLCSQGDEGLWHIDVMNPAYKSSIEYIVSDCFGTEFLSAGTEMGEIDESRSTDSLASVEQYRKAFAKTASQHPHSIVKALPYEVMKFDETLPHRAQNTASTVMRTMLRLVFIEP